MTPFEEQLAADLLTIRPEPALAFAAELDARVAAGFPRRAGAPGRRREPRRMFMQLAAAATCVVVAGVAIVESNPSGSSTTGPQPKPVPVQAQASPSTGGAAQPNAAGGANGAPAVPANRGNALGDLVPSVRTPVPD